MKWFGIFAVFLFSAVFSLAHEEHPETAIKVETLASTGESWDGSELPPYPDGGPRITILRITVPAGARLPLHTHPFINAGVLLSGELTVRTPDGAKKVLRAGEALVELVDKPHFGANTGDGPATIVVFYAGIEGEPVTVLVGAEGEE